MTLQPPKAVPSTFQGLGIEPKILSILESLNFTIPTPIQHQAIPVAITGKDVIGIAQTGTGKTLAFGVPLLQRILTHKGQALILLPTRELALQVDETLRKIARPLGMSTAVLIGGAALFSQVNALRRNPQIIIATPGRLADHLQQRNLTLNAVNIVVLDEADRMFDIGFAPEINRILKLITQKHQTMLFSATMPPPIAAMIAHHLSLPARIEVAPAGTAAQKVEQEIFIINKENKLQLLDKILTDYRGAILVFSRTKYTVKRITAAVRQMGHHAAELHSNRSLGQRRQALDGFKSGAYRVLVATDIAARGIDVVGIELVVNYDLPDNSEDYVHRIGRTGRAGQTGKAISFASPDQRGDIRNIERLIRRTIPVVAVPPLPAARTYAAPTNFNNPSFSRRPHGFQRNQGGAARGQRPPRRDASQRNDRPRY